MVDCAEAVKKVVNIPVFAVGKLGYHELAEKVLQEGKADFIVIGRALLADPEWPNKVKQGKLDDIRPCIGCHDGCMFRIVRRKHLSCAVNPTTGNERELALQPAEKPKSVLVVGGGPAGMEAARVAALRGHHVTLMEKNARLGGSLIPASIPDFKNDLRLFMNYLSTQIEKLNVDVQLGKEATPEIIQQMRPDMVIIATGAAPAIPEIPGTEKDLVVTGVDVLSGTKDVGEIVVVIGGGLIGCETALFLADNGKKVTVVEMLSELVPREYLASRIMLKEMLTQRKVEVLADTILREILDDGVIVENKLQGKQKLKADSVVLCVGLAPRDELQQALEGKVTDYRCIGECIGAPKVMGAIWGAFRLARLT
jgi:2-enoate reductase